MHPEKSLLQARNFPPFFDVRISVFERVMGGPIH
jgi:hypothetical protein